MNGWINGWMDRRTDEWLDSGMGWMDEWTDE